MCDNGVMNATEAQKVLKTASASRCDVDRERSMVYRAEDRAFGGSAWDAVKVAQVDVLPLVEEAMRWAHENLLDTDWKVYIPRIEWNGSKGSKGASAMGSWCDEGLLTFPFGRELSVAVILHEVAHLLSPWDAGHGKAFRAAYAALVREFMGPDYADRLQAEFESMKPRRFQLEVSADGGKTWTAAKTRRCYELSASSAAWMRGAPNRRVSTWDLDTMQAVKLRMIPK